MSLKVTIFIPAYNRPKTILRAVDSALNQDYPNLGVLVGDDSTNDEVYNVIKPYLTDNRVKYYKNETNLGMLGNWRKGLYQYIKSDYFIIMGDDDYLINDNYISQAVNIIKSNENILMVFSNSYLEYLKKNNSREAVSFNYDNIVSGKEIFMNAKNLNVGAFLITLLYNTEFAIKINAFEDDDNLGWDLKLYLYCALSGNVGFIKEFSGVHTLHNENLSILSSLEEINFIKGNVEAVIDPFNYAIQHNLLSKTETEKWKNEVIFQTFFKSLVHMKYNNPSKYEEFIKFLVLKNEDVLNRVLNSNKFRLVILLEKLHIFNLTYGLIFNLKFGK